MRCCEVCLVSLLDIRRKPKATSSKSHPSVAVIRRDHRWTGAVCGPNNNMSGRPEGQEAQQDRPMLRKALLSESKRKKKKNRQVQFQLEPIPSLSYISMLSLLRITKLVENWSWYWWIKARMKTSFYLCPPSIIQVLDLTKIYRKIFVFSILINMRRVLYLRFHSRQFHCFYSFWAHG